MEAVATIPVIEAPPLPPPAAPREWDLVSPFPKKAWPRVWVWMEEFRRRVMDDFSPQTLEDFVAERLALEGREVTWGVVRDGELGGLIRIAPMSPYLVTAHVIFKRSFWGSETTVEAMAEVFRQVFDLGVRKIASVAYADNHQILALVRKLGGDKEGHLYANTLRDGKPTDQMLLGLTYENFMKARATK